MNSKKNNERDPADFYDFGPEPPPDPEWEKAVIPEHVRALPKYRPPANPKK